LRPVAIERSPAGCDKRHTPAGGHGVATGEAGRFGLFTGLCAPAAEGKVTPIDLLLQKATTVQAHATHSTDYEVRFQSLFQEGRALAFPCDPHGRVDVDALTPKAKHNYLLAHAMVGREYAHPAVLPRACIDPRSRHRRRHA
jgi:hypothetical protein